MFSTHFFYFNFIYIVLLLTNMKKIAVILIIVILSVFVYKRFVKDPRVGLNLTKVIKGNIYTEVSETGQVTKGNKVNVSFKSAGTIEDIYVEVGQMVKTGDALAEIEDSQLKIKLEEAKAGLEIAWAQFDKLLAGATREEIQTMQTNIENAKIDLVIAEQNLEDVKNQTGEDLNSVYNDTLAVLDDVYLKISNSFNVSDLIKRTYFVTNNQIGIKINNNNNEIKNALIQTELHLDIIRESQNEDIDTAIFEIKELLQTVSEALTFFRDTCEGPSYRNKVSSTDKTSLDNNRTYINTALTNIIALQQDISSAKLASIDDVNIYQTKVDSAKGKLKASEDNFAEITASARKEDVELHQAQVKQAEAQVSLFTTQLEDAILRSPINGQVADINKRVGEIVQATFQDSIMVILPESSFEIEVDIYEEDIVKIRTGNDVDISIVAFPDQMLEGRVISINPAEKMIDGVVYYQVSVSLDNAPEGIKSGMTADLIIKIITKENVLIIPEEAIEEKNGKTIVKLLEGRSIKEREINIGIVGDDDMAEVTFGLEEGNEIVIE